MARIGTRRPAPGDDLEPSGGPDQPGTSLAQNDTAEVAAYSPELVAKVRELVADIPDNSDSGAEAIVAQLLAAETIDDLNAPWDGTSGRNLAGKRLTVRGVSARPSSFEGGAGIFLVADAVDAKTGERAVFTTSALAVVIQLAQAHKRQMFPLLVEVVVAERPTARGFYPYHLRVLAAGRAASGAPAPGASG